MTDRRTFLRALAGAAVVGAAGAVARPAVAAAGADVDPAAVAALDAGQVPGQWGTSLPGIVTSFAPTGKQLALTFDLCDRACDDALLDTLRTHGAPAVLFACGKWIADQPGRVERLAAEPLFEIGNHGTRHVPLSVTGRSAYGIAGTRSVAEAVDEVWANQNRIASLTGTAPTWFRTGTAYYDDVGVRVVRQLGLTPVGFAVNADAGATLPAARVAAAVTHAAPGSIVLAHANHPEGGTAAGMATAIPAQQAAGWEFVRLSGQAVR